ncbi:MAG: hypothetical protein HYR86_11570 [Candidatus Rokubacteria bacterium]|nr:hypothetical protein [Candidatus Rokubacteria bacterium]
MRREYWWRALAAVALPPRPRTLLVGLGGGTQVHLLHRLARPRSITLIERDPAILHAAWEFFGLKRVGGLEFLCGDTDVVVPWLAAVRRRFDFVMEDAAYADPTERAMTLPLALADRLSPRGVLVVNRHWRADAGRLLAALRPRFLDVRVRRVRREGENSLICCSRPLRQPGSAG